MLQPMATRLCSTPINCNTAPSSHIDGRCPLHPPLIHKTAMMLLDADNLLGTLPAHSAASMAVSLLQWLSLHDGLSVTTSRAYANPSTQGLGRGRSLQTLLDATGSELVQTSGRRCAVASVSCTQFVVPASSMAGKPLTWLWCQMVLCTSEARGLREHWWCFQQTQMCTSCCNMPRE